MRAFLSHSSTDKNFVGAVAEALGRAKVVFDAFEFATGDDFVSAINQGLERSAVFVLFASQKALASDWVNLELTEAQKRLARAALSSAACYIIDDTLGVSDLPDWLKDTLVTRQTNARLVSLDILRLINDRSAARRPQFFVGRTQRLEDALDNIAADVRPVFVHGLPGIGRKTFVAEVARNHLSYQKLVTIELRSGDELPELSLYISDSLGLLTGLNPQDFLDGQKLKDTEELTNEIIENLKTICASGALPVMVDVGAMSGDEGILLSQFEFLLDVFTPIASIDLAIVSTRRMRRKDGQQLKGVRLDELEPSSTQHLLRLLARHERASITKEQLDVTAIYVAGYPPAAQFAIDEVKAYGAAHVVQNQRAIVNFNSRIFIKQLEEDNKITPLMRTILQVLSAHSPLPLEVLAEYAGGKDSEQFGTAISHLVDYAFVIPEGPHYRIAAPIRDAVYRNFSGMLVDHSKVADGLEAYLDRNDDDDIRISLSQVLFRAVSLSHGKHSKHALGLASDLINVTTQSYYDENYDRTLEFGRLAIEARPSNIDIRRVVAQAHIRKEQFPEAENQIAEMKRLGALKEAFFVQGFLERRRGDNNKAISHFLKSIEYGRGGVAVHRELAQCYFYIGDIPHAAEHIRIAEQNDSLNRFIVDLRCKIAMRQGDRTEVDRCLNLLQRIDSGGFSFHRRSTYLLSQGRIDEALELALKAVEQTHRPTYEVLAHLANCHIEVGNFGEAAEVLRSVDARFPGVRRDARLGLRCKLETRRGDLDSAESLWNRLESKTKTVHLALRISILNQKPSLTQEELSEREELKEKLDAAALDTDAALLNFVEL